jgi:hypothetical protein
MTGRRNSQNSRRNYGRPRGASGGALRRLPSALLEQHGGSQLETPSAPPLGSESPSHVGSRNSGRCFPEILAGAADTGSASSRPA